MGETLTKDKWIDRVLGVSYPRGTPGGSGRQVRFSPVTTDMPPPSGAGLRLGQTRPRSGNRIAPPPPLPPPGEFTGAGGKKISVVKTLDGRVAYTAPPPPVREVTFSGGGAKGAALPGAVKALEDGGILRDAKKITGASVGSMTAALVAAGATAEEFEEIANAPETTDRITEGSGGTKRGLLAAAMKNKVMGRGGNPLTGQGLEDVVRDALGGTIGKRIVEYKLACAEGGRPPDPVVDQILDRLSSGPNGPTFKEMRQLSQVIPAIKEVVITGTYTDEFETDDKGKKKKLKGGNTDGQLYVFDADSEPDLEVAVAVHASASFPVAFKPVDITLSSGLTVRFIDGGVMNNTPTSSSIGNERNLDPVPESRGITFVFEDKGGVADGLVNGSVTPAQGLGARTIDWFLGSKHNAGEYAKDRDMTDHREDIIKVPLKIPLPPKQSGGKAREVDMRDGTLNFGLDDEAKAALQDATEEATSRHIADQQKPKTRSFASDSQMFVSIPLADLKALADGGYEGAGDAHVFRERVAEMIGKLTDAVKAETAKRGGDVANVLNDRNAVMALDELENLSGGDVDFQGYVGREMNKGGLDSLIEKLRGRGAQGGALAAVMAVSDALKAHTWADNILKQLVYPKMTKERDGGSAIEVLLIVEGILRAAKTAGDVNEAIGIAVEHFSKKSDKKPPGRGHKRFAAEMQRRVMPTN